MQVPSYLTNTKELLKNLKNSFVQKKSHKTQIPKSIERQQRKIFNIRIYAHYMIVKF